MNREWLVDEVLMLMPTLMRAIGGPDPAEMAEFASRGVPTEVRISPGHVQIMIALTRGPHSAGQLAEVLGVSPPAARRVVLVDYVPAMRDVARRLMEVRRRRLTEAMERLSDEEARMFVRGLRSLAEGFGAAPEGS